MTNPIVAAAVGRKRTTLLLMLMVVIAGLAARISIPIEAQPSIDVPMFVVSVYHEGISPEDATRLLVRPLEIELKTVEGVNEIQGTGRQGLAYVIVEFDADYDLAQALLDVREAVDRARPEMPTTAEEPIIMEQSADDFPIIQVNLVGEDVNERILYNLAQDLRDDIETISAVLEAQMQGNREEVLEVVIDPAALEAYAVSNEQLISTVVRNNRLIPAGSLDNGSGRMAIKVPGVIEDATDVFDLPIKVDGDSVVTLSDLATIRRTFKDRESYARVNGNRTISINVVKRQNSNIVDTIAEVKEVVDRHRSTFPNRVSVFYSQDQAPFALSQVVELQGNIVTALVLVMVLVVASIGMRSGIIVGLGIPVSFLFALIFVWLNGYTFNFMVMFGMLLGLGMLIDGAIVVTEYADRKMAEGMKADEAFRSAATRMFWPVVASTATTLAAFLPLMFWPGVSGKFMSYLPVTVFCVLAGSLLYALVFGPTVGAVIGNLSEKYGIKRNKRYDANLTALEDSDPREMNGFIGWYARLLGLTSRFAFTTVIVTIGTLFGSFALYGAYGKGVEFFSEGEAQFARVAVRARGNLSADEKHDLVREVERELLEIPGIKDLNTSTRAGGGMMMMGTTRDTIGTMYLEFHEENERELSGNEILRLVRERTANFAGVKVEVQQQEMGPPVGKDLYIQFASDSVEPLNTVVGQVRDHLEANVTGLIDLEDTRPLPGIEWELSVDRAQAALYGADVSLVGIAVQLVTNGVLVGEYRPDRADDAVDIRVRYPATERGIQALDTLRVMTDRGRVPISNFVVRTPAQSVNAIERLDGRFVKNIRANVVEGILADTKVKEIRAWLDTVNFDPRVDIAFRGANEEQTDAAAFIQIAFTMSILLMFVLLVTQFNSLYQPVLILFAVIMSTAGVLLGLLIFDKPFSVVMTGVGIVALAGIVVNNNIVLIDTFNQIRRDNPHLDTIEAIVRTGAQRFRPVMLTTVTTVFGLLPLAANFSIDFINRTIMHGSQLSSFWVPLSQAIVSGLTFATLLTLVSTPAMLALPDKVKSAGRRIRHIRRPRSAAVQDPAPAS